MRVLPVTSEQLGYQGNFTVHLLWRMQGQTPAAEAQAQLQTRPEGLADASGAVRGKRRLQTACATIALFPTITVAFARFADAPRMPRRQQSCLLARLSIETGVP